MKFPEGEAVRLANEFVNKLDGKPPHHKPSYSEMLMMRGVYPHDFSFPEEEPPTDDEEDDLE